MRKFQKQYSHLNWIVLKNPKEVRNFIKEIEEK
jgi:hypothetical protein